MTIQHKTITGTDLHEPKGVAAAAANKVYVANGSASGAWATLAAASITDNAITTAKILDANVTTAKITNLNVTSGKIAASAITTDKTNLPKGKFYFYNIGSPYTLAHSGSTAKVAPTTIASGLGSLVTEATSARLTYTGTLTAVVKLDFDVSLKQASGADRDIMISVHRNGSVIAGSQVLVTSVTGDLHQAAGSCFYNAADNDYFEIYAQNTGASGDMVFQKVGLTLTAT